MSHFDYVASRNLEAEQYPFYALIMTAMRQADTHNQMLLETVFPGVWQELRARYDAPGGVLPTDVPALIDIEVRELSIDPDVFTFAEGIDNRITVVEAGSAEPTAEEVKKAKQVLPHYTC